MEDKKMNPVRCQVAQCPRKNLTSWTRLLRHLELYHPLLDVYSCHNSRCIATFSNLEELKQHYHEAHERHISQELPTDPLEVPRIKLRCSFGSCDVQEFITLLDFSRHLEICHHDALIECPFVGCSSHFASRYSFRNHLVRKHPDATIFTTKQKFWANGPQVSPEVDDDSCGSSPMEVSIKDYEVFTKDDELPLDNESSHNSPRLAFVDSLNKLEVDFNVSKMAVERVRQEIFRFIQQLHEETLQIVEQGLGNLNVDASSKDQLLRNMQESTTVKLLEEFTTGGELYKIENPIKSDPDVAPKETELPSSEGSSKPVDVKYQYISIADDDDLPVSEDELMYPDKLEASVAYYDENPREDKIDVRNNVVGIPEQPIEDVTSEDCSTITEAYSFIVEPSDNGVSSSLRQVASLKAAIGNKMPPGLHLPVAASLNTPEPSYNNSGSSLNTPVAWINTSGSSLRMPVAGIATPGSSNNTPVASYITPGSQGPPCTEDFLTPLRNGFTAVISPRLDIKAREALRMKKTPQELGDYQAKQVKSAILKAVFDYALESLQYTRPLHSQECSHVATSIQCAYFEMFGKILEKDQKPVGGQGRKVGIDTLKIVVLNGCNYRYRKHQMINILKESQKKKLEASGEAKLRQPPKQKEVFIVNKDKWYSTASKDDLSTLPQIVESEKNHRILQHTIRTRTTRLSEAVPSMKDASNLKAQFIWLAEGDIEERIEDRLPKEMDNLEKYLMYVGKPSVVEMIENGTLEGDQFFNLSGQTFKWVSVLRASELNWRLQDDDRVVLFRTEEEGISGDCPQILVRCLNRRVTFCVAVEGEPFIEGISSLAKAISSFLELCFVAQLEYPAGAAMLCLLLQRRLAKLDENGAQARVVRDLVNKLDTKHKPYEKQYDHYRLTLFNMLN